MSRGDLAVGLAGSAAGSVLAAVEGVGGGLDGLLVYGPLGIICAWLLVRSHLREKEYDRALEAKDAAHAEERAEAWRAVTGLRNRIDTSMEGLRDDTREQLKVLTEIATLLRNRDR